MSKSCNKWEYGNSWDKFPINIGQTWVEMKTNSSFAVHDLFDPLPAFMMSGDMIYCDPPWTLGNVNSFVTKNHSSKYISNFKDFYTQLFAQVGVIAPRVCFLEIGKKHVDEFNTEMGKLFPTVQVWKTTYYKKHPCFLLRGGYEPASFDYTGSDDEDTPSLAIRNESPSCVADLCTGRGLTAVSAISQNKRFVGIELNPRRMAVTLDKVSKKGGDICQK